MANQKDPAFLFYSKDFYEGTRMMLPSERACFIDLLIYQHQNGFIPSDLSLVVTFCSPISIDIIKSVLDEYFIKSENGWINNKGYLKPMGNTSFFHYNWKGGVYDTIAKIRNSPQYRKWKLSVRKKYNNTCAECGSNKKLHAHHIKPFAIFPELRFEISNGLLLCQSCHISYHKSNS